MQTHTHTHTQTHTQMERERDKFIDHKQINDVTIKIINF